MKLMTVTRVAAYRLGILVRLPWTFVRSGWKQMLLLVIGIIGVALVVSVAYRDTLSGLAAERERLHEKLERLETINFAMKNRNAELTRRVEALKTKRELLERQAREDLGLVRDGDVVVILPK